MTGEGVFYLVLLVLWVVGCIKYYRQMVKQEQKDKYEYERWVRSMRKNQKDYYRELE